MRLSIGRPGLRVQDHWKWHHLIDRTSSSYSPSIVTMALLGMQSRTVLPISGLSMLNPGIPGLIPGLNRARLWLAIAGLVIGKIATTSLNKV